MVKLLFRSGQPQQAIAPSKGQTPSSVMCLSNDTCDFSVVMAGSSRRAGSAAVAAAKRVRGYLPVPETVDST